MDMVRVGKCAAERVKLNENARAIALAARLTLGAADNARIILALASFFLHCADHLDSDSNFLILYPSK